MRPIQILRPGKFKAANGQEVSLSAADLETIALNYEPTLFMSPIVIGHPKSADPAYGWVKSINFAEGLLIAEADKIDPQFAELVTAGRYQKVSASLFPPTSAANPKPGSYYLRHVGFLGAAAPAVSGLQPVSLSADEGEIISIEFAAEGVEPGKGKTQKEEDLDAEKKRLEEQKKAQDEKEAALTKKEKGLKRIEFSAFVDGLTKGGKILPAFQTPLVDFMESIDNDTLIDFAEDKKLSALDFFKDYLQKQPKVVNFGEFAPDSKLAPEDATPNRVAEKATKLKEKLQVEGVSISFAEAVERVNGGEQ